MTVDTRCHMLITAAVGFALYGCTDASAPVAAPPASLEAVTSRVLEGVVGAGVDPLPAVRVKDERGRGVAGVLVNFRAIASARSFSTTAITDSTGLATVISWTLGTIAGFDTLSATVTGLTPLLFVAAAKAGPFAQLTAAAGNRQSGLAGAPLALAPSVRTSDFYGNPVKGVAVTFGVVAGDGRIEGIVAVSDSLGIASSGAWILGSTQRLQFAYARAGGREVMFEAYAPLAECGTPCTGNGVAFERGNRIMTMSENGTDVTDFTAGKTPSWSPDRARIVYSKSDSLWILNVRTGTTFSITNVSGFLDSHPSWSPDGSQIAFLRYWDDQSYLAVVNAYDGSERILSMWWPAPGQITWSPDNLKIAFTCEGPAPQWESDICTIPANGSSGYFYTEASNRGLNKMMLDKFTDTDPSWAPDGSLIAFTTNRFGGSYIAVGKPDGTGIVKLVPGHHPAWSPDGKQIVFAGVADDHGLYVVNANGTGAVKLTNEGADKAPSWSR